MAVDPFADMAAEAADVSAIPSDGEMSRMRVAALKHLELSTLVADLEAKLKRANEALYESRTRTMPDLMKELGFDEFVLADTGAKLELRSTYHSNIAAEWSEERREAAFAYLDENEGGDIIKDTITVFFGRDRAADRAEWIRKVRGLNFSFDPPPLAETKAVPWNTLTAWVREQIQMGVQLDLEKIGATVGSEVVIKPRK